VLAIQGFGSLLSVFTGPMQDWATEMKLPIRSNSSTYSSSYNISLDPVRNYGTRIGVKKMSRYVLSTGRSRVFLVLLNAVALALFVVYSSLELEIEEIDGAHGTQGQFRGRRLLNEHDEKDNAELSFVAK
jgi:hypothetical protein